MLYEFRSRATGSVTMLGKTAEQILAIIGKDIEPKGIITVAQIPAAIEALEYAAEHEPPPDEEEDKGDKKDKASGFDDDKGPHISLRQRIVPLVEMLREAHAAEADVTWGV